MHKTRDNQRKLLSALLGHSGLRADHALWSNRTRAEVTRHAGDQ
ncbi:MAG: hypothetical protein OJF62_001085 [Pseudolabrys sp.]|nr:hypothetical protein [Pseudolabrys sp.]